MTKAQRVAVRNYLVSLRDPSALRDDDAIATLQETIDQTDDPVERLTLRQRLLDLRNPPLEQYEAAFVEHAKAWADDTGVTAAPFTAEGVPAAVLRRAASVASPTATRDAHGAPSGGHRGRGVESAPTKSAPPSPPARSPSKSSSWPAEHPPR